jgi:hypothetical protein
MAGNSSQSQSSALDCSATFPNVEPYGDISGYGVSSGHLRAKSSGGILK